MQPEPAASCSVTLRSTARRRRDSRARPREAIVLSLIDPALWSRRPRLEVRRNSTEPYRTLQSTFANGKLRAKMDRGSASKIDIRVTASDNAGNVTQGNPTRLTATSAKVGRRFRGVRSGRVKIPFGRRATLRGRLTLSAGQSLAGQTVLATSAVRKQRRKDEVGRHGHHRPPRPLLAQGPCGPEPHVPPRLCWLRRRTRHRPRRLCPRAGLEHDPRLPDAPRRRPGPLLRAPAQPRTTHPRPRPRAGPPGPRSAASGARSRTPARTARAAGTSPTASAAARGLPDPRPHPQAVGLPLRARLLAQR